MGIFDMFKRQKPSAKNENNEWAAYAQKMCATAIEYAKEFGKTLDFTENSITDLEEILDWYAKDRLVSNPTENQILSMAIIFGSYLGETLLKNGLAQKGFAWGIDAFSNVPLLIKDDGSCLAPNDKVYKRLANGSEDSVISFFRFATRVI